MRDRKSETSQLDDRWARAETKINEQKAIVDRMNGSAHEHPEEQRLLTQMRQNKAVIEFARALFDYDEACDSGETSARGARPAG